MKPGQINVEMHQVHVPSPVEASRTVAQYLHEHLMACRNCGQTMKRGTKCQNCGSWCR